MYVDLNTKINLNLKTIYIGQNSDDRVKGPFQQDLYSQLLAPVNIKSSWGSQIALHSQN